MYPFTYERVITMEINQIICLFHREKPEEYTLKTIRLDEEDSRWILFLKIKKERYVIKIAANSFTTGERVSGWNGIIDEYRKMGYYSPRILKSIQGNYWEQISFEGKNCIIWEEEYARYSLYGTRDKSFYIGKDGKYIYHDEVLEFIGRVGQKHFSNFPYVSGWSRLEPFDDGETTDEVTQCVETLEGLVKEKAPQLWERWTNIREQWEQNKAKLEQIYPRLPTSVFQGDPYTNNLVLDEQGHLKGVIDYNLAGKDTVLNMFFSLVLFGYSYQRKSSADPQALPQLNRETQDSVIEILLDSLRFLRKYYTFQEIEVEAAPLLFKYITAIEYTQIDAFEKYQKDDKKLSLLFDYMEHELLRKEIDFREAMLGELTETSKTDEYGN